MLLPPWNGTGRNWVLQLGAASRRSFGQGNKPTAGEGVGEGPRVHPGTFSPFSFPKIQAGTLQGLSEISSGFSGLSRWVELEQLLGSWGYSCLIPVAWRALQEPFPDLLSCCHLLSPLLARKSKPGAGERRLLSEQEFISPKHRRVSHLPNPLQIQDFTTI